MCLDPSFDHLPFIRMTKWTDNDRILHHLISNTAFELLRNTPLATLGILSLTSMLLLSSRSVIQLLVLFHSTTTRMSPFSVMYFAPWLRASITGPPRTVTASLPLFDGATTRGGVAVGVA